MAHVIVSEAEAILDKEFKVLNAGFLRLIDYMGGDESIVQAARVSYGKGTKSASEDRTLLRYLMRHRHTTPFEMVELKFHVKLPIFVARQWIRHRTANVNELSGRYSIMKDEFFVPAPDTVTRQSIRNKQGRADEEVPADLRRKVLDILLADQQLLYHHYKELLEENIARELARINLPLSLYTEWYWKIDLHNLLHFLQLRTDKHAQYEIRVYAETMGEIVKRLAPLSWEAFQDYIIAAEQFSRIELEYLANHMDGKEITKQELERHGISGLEAEEFLDKMKRRKLTKG